MTEGITDSCEVLQSTDPGRREMMRNAIQMVWLGIFSDQASRFVFMATRFRKREWVNLHL